MNGSPQIRKSQNIINIVANTAAEKDTSAIDSDGFIERRIAIAPRYAVMRVVYENIRNSLFHLFFS